MGLSPPGCPPAYLPSCGRFQGDSRLEQPGCSHRCVDENIERRNHYLDLAGVENYTSQFGAGKVAPAPARREGGGGGRAGRGYCSPLLGEGRAFIRQVKDVIGRDDIKNV